MLKKLFALFVLAGVQLVLDDIPQVDEGVKYTMSPLFQTVCNPGPCVTL